MKTAAEFIQSEIEKSEVIKEQQKEIDILKECVSVNNKSVAQIVEAIDRILIHFRV
tara:strand:+ start:345 stop:512 length:168 start_codon:yes stop_codon:yes gene_type:complete